MNTHSHIQAQIIHKVLPDGNSNSKNGANGSSPSKSNITISHRGLFL